MAKIAYSDNFWTEFDEYVHNSLILFGRKTSKKWTDSLQAIVKSLKMMPESYSYMRIGKKIYKEFRGATIMSNFKLVYTYDEKNDLVKILTILDMRQNTKTLNGFLSKL